MKVHQNIIIDGIDYGQLKDRKHSKFCNEGKWNTFIKPLLPKNCKDKTLVEFGSNAGLFLKLAKEVGFKTVVGLEQSKIHYDMSHKYKESLDMDYKIIREYFDENWDFNKIPLSDVTILANFHYHQYLTDLLYLIDKLKYKTRYVIIVSVEDPSRLHYKGAKKISNVRNYFKEWKELDSITDVSKKNDSHPRNMYSIAFESSLQTRNIDDLYTLTADGNHKLYIHKEVEMVVDSVLNNTDLKIKNTEYFELMYKMKRHRLTKEQVYDVVNQRLKTVKDIIQNGIKKPILIDKNNRVLDGVHRLTTLKKLGHKKIIVRVI